MSAIDRLDLDLGARRYEILIGRNLIAESGAHLLPILRQKRVVVVTDRHVARHHWEPCRAGLAAAGIAVETIVLEPGEASKSFASLEALLARLLELRVERRTTLVALGGGVIGDLVGFAAAILLRGLDFVQIPTTLLAQVDSSVGGKTGINMAAGKNLVGAFYQPRRVLIDLDALATLPRRELLAGYAEIVKYGLIDQPDFFAWLEANGADLLAGSEAARHYAIRRSCAAKAAIVAADETEAGARALLNLGHTFAHALETETGYSDLLLHGEAVAIGLRLAFDLSAALGLCSAADAERVRQHLRAVGLPDSPRAIADIAWSTDRLIAHMSQDKKVVDGRIGFVLARGIGQAFHPGHADLPILRRVLDAALAN